MRQALIESHINQLVASFGAVKVPVGDDKLRAMFDARDYHGMVGHIQGKLLLDLKLQLGLVNSGGPDAPAWIVPPKVMPMFGTQAFKQLTVVMYLRKSFLEKSSFEVTVMAIAHELSHIVLHSTQHSLRYTEEAVDLTAMLLGFRDFYVTGCRSMRYLAPTEAQMRDGVDVIKSTTAAGYLSFDEVSHAATYMTYPPKQS